MAAPMRRATLGCLKNYFQISSLSLSQNTLLCDTSRDALTGVSFPSCVCPCRQLFTQQPSDFVSRQVWEHDIVDVRKAPKVARVANRVRWGPTGPSEMVGMFRQPLSLVRTLSSSSKKTVSCPSLNQQISSQHFAGRPALAAVPPAVALSLGPCWTTQAAKTAGKIPTHCSLHNSRRSYRARKGQDEESETWQETLERQRLEAEELDYAWMLRTSVENSYLSWVRNCYIMTVAAVTVYTQLTVPLAQEAAIVFLLSGGISLISGTTAYTHNILTRRRRMAMSAPTALVSGAMAVFHVILWISGVLVYLGYVEEDDSPLDEEVFINNEETEDCQRHSRREKRGSRRTISDKHD